MVLSAVKAPISYGFRRAIGGRLAAGRNRMLFIVGHMRSGSSLLVHLLANNPEILGYGETHEHHEKTADFSRVAWKILRSFGRVWPRERYILDKVLHARFGPTPELLLSGDTRTLLLIRRPESTLPSILGLGLPAWTTEDEATDYYVDRLATVRSLADELGPGRCRFVTYEQLVDDAGATLAELTHFLELAEPLTEEYGLLWSTGRFGLGDPSEKIRAGRIVKAPKAPKPELSEPCLARAVAAYEECVESCARAGVAGPTPKDGWAAAGSPRSTA